MFYHVKDFVEDWIKESAGTLKIMQLLTDVSLNRRVTPEGRSLGRIAWHIVTSLVEIARRMNLKVDAPVENAPVPSTAHEIVTAYERAARSMLVSIQNWQDEVLAKKDVMFGQRWKRCYSLQVLIYHQIHHRGQMTVLMRQAGLKVPGVCGPSREEWSNYGAPPQE
jgi:uncharacterized damage-inducible protein DinB